jgi:hypothetical protein
MKLLGICGLARCGKDSFYNLSEPIIKEKKEASVRYAFADSLKAEIDELLLKNTGMSAFSEDPLEKTIIRPLLVTYGTHVRRKIDQDCWIKSIDFPVKNTISHNQWAFVTDVRYDNEIDWIHDLGGKSVHITRTGTLPPNEEEKENDPILKSKSDFFIEWDDFEKENMEEISNKVREVLQSIE